MAAKAAVAPATARSSPPSAGPMARAILNPIEVRTSACVSHRRGTVSGTEAAHAGLFNAAPTASRTVNDSRSVASRRPSAATSARITAAASISMLVRIRWRLRSIKSAKAPAGSARTSTGSCAAAWTRLTINGLGARSVMIHALAVFWIQVPRAEIVLASHSQKNARLANGAPAGMRLRKVGILCGVTLVLRRHVLPR